MSTEQILLSIAVSLFVGLMMTRLLKPLKLPDVTSYLLGGVLIGAFCLGGFLINGYSIGFHATASPVDAFTIISDITLGFIAFDIGNEFRLKDIKKTGKQAAVIGVLQAVVATVLVDAVLIATHYILLSAVGTDILPLPACLILGAIATATAPAATLMVVRQYKAKGALTDLLLPIVALDDAVGLVVFAVSFGIAKALYGGSVDVISVVVNPIVEIALSLILGTVAGLILSQVEKLFHSRSNRLSLIIMFVFLTVVCAHLSVKVGAVTLGFSPLLTCMMFGTVFCNTCSTSDELMERTERWTKPLYILFFVISGASLDLSVFTKPIFVLIGILYILFRSIGKYFGAMGSAKLVGCEKNTVRYLGITLLPQAGVSLGMVSTVVSDATFGSTEIAKTVRFVILFAVLVYEVVGPVLTKWALTRAGDISAKPVGITARRENAPHA